MNNKNGWDQLKCENFADVCRKVLNDYLEELGFSEKKETARGTVVYSRFDLFLEIGYDITHSDPMYSLSAVVGFGEEESGSFSGIPMWYILPRDHPYRTKVHWSFRTEGDLERDLEELKEEFLEATLKPLLLNREGLERVIGSFQSEFC